MAWRGMVLLVSIALHCLWFTFETRFEPVEIGGAARLPESVSISLVSVKPVVEASTERAPVTEFEPNRVAEPVLLESPLEPLKKAQFQPAIPSSSESQQTEVEAFNESGERLNSEVSVAASSAEPLAADALPVITDADFRSRPSPPVYPTLALRKRQQGEALVRALVDRWGNTLEIKLVRSSGFELLDRSAMDAVEGWEFQAARVDGVAVSAWVEVPVAFTINR